MTPDELSAYVDAHPAAQVDPPSEQGWFRIQYVPLDATALDLLLDDGTVMEGVGPSNPLFITEARTFIGWKPRPVEWVKAREAARYAGTMNADELAAYMASIDRAYEMRGSY